MTYEFEFARDALTKATHTALAYWGVKWKAASDAPDTLQGVVQHWRLHGQVLVWNGASERTIYRTPFDNMAARAWHDYRHVMGLHEFDLEGERATCEAQGRDLGFLVASDALTPSEAGAAWALLRLEVIGQAEHFAACGEFPANQLAWTREKWSEIYGNA